ncbi:hypothetical protein BCV70DRAFT_38742 [Testicularia cyperi]|uniref:BRCT domain-containing protein n=1 Tax=Testicularia cyperi TaxID=1882483 RepID=A0A317XL05_9BASI|nr:hypothetical protein BCV70DRAFT_38742 [Testicularia cyperi]
MEFVTLPPDSDMDEAHSPPRHDASAEMLPASPRAQSIDVTETTAAHDPVTARPPSPPHHDTPTATEPAIVATLQPPSPPPTTTTTTTTTTTAVLESTTTEKRPLAAPASDSIITDAHQTSPEPQAVPAEPAAQTMVQSERIAVTATEAEQTTSQPTPQPTAQPTVPSMAAAIQPASAPAPRASAAPEPKAKIFEKGPREPNHFYFQEPMAHATIRQLVLAIRSQGGVRESRFAKADFIVIDPQQAVAARKLMRDARNLGQPIPVITIDYVLHSDQQNQLLDMEAPEYHPHTLLEAAPSSSSAATPTAKMNGRNPFTESERTHIVDYFVRRDASLWSLNAAAKDLAEILPSHTRTSYQTYLQNNWEKGWNLKQQVLERCKATNMVGANVDRPATHVSETTAPNDEEESSPSDGWPEASSPLRPRVDPHLRGSEAAGGDKDHGATAAGSNADTGLRRRGRVEEESSPPLDEIAVRRPNPGSGTATVERSPAKTSRNQEVPDRFSPPIEEESEPEGGWTYSQKVLDQIGRSANGTASHQKRAAQTQQPSRRQLERRGSTTTSDNSSPAPDFDELDSSGNDSDDDNDSGHPSRTAAEPENGEPVLKGRHNADTDEEWTGARRADARLRELERKAQTAGHGDNSAEEAPVRIKFLEDEKNQLVQRLATLVRTAKHRGQDNHSALLDRPPEQFWHEFAEQNQRHSHMSWKSHFLKNRPTYKQAVALLLESDEDPETDSSDAESEEPARQSQQRVTDDARLRADNNEDLQEMREVEAVVELTPRTDKASNDSNAEDDEHIDELGIVVEIPAVAGTDELSRIESDSEATHHSSSANDDQISAKSPNEEDGDSVEFEYVTRDDSDNRRRTEPAQAVPVPGGAAAEPDTASTRRRSAALPSSSPNRPVPADRSLHEGVSVLEQHREAPFYDFTMDSDEEERLLLSRSRAKRSLPSTPRSATRTAAAVAVPASVPVIGRPLSTPVGRRVGRGPAAAASVLTEERTRAERTRDWARSVSVSTPSGSPEAIEPQPDLFHAAAARRVPARRKTEEVVSAAATARRHYAEKVQGRINASFSIPRPEKATAASSSSREVRQEPQAFVYESVDRSRRSHRSEREEAAEEERRHLQELERQHAIRNELEQRHRQARQEEERQKYRERFKEFCSAFGFDKKEAYSIVVQFDGSVRDSTRHVQQWCGDMTEQYDTDVDVALEYLKTAKGNFEEAETYIRLSTTVERSRNLSTSPRRSIGRSTSMILEGASATSPRKRPSSYLVEERVPRSTSLREGMHLDYGVKRQRRRSGLR